MTRFMRKNGNAETTAPAPPDKVASYEIGEDEAGMRLDRWLHRRFPDVSNSHLMRIVRKGEVRVSGKRADIRPGWRPAKVCACRHYGSRQRRVRPSNAPIRAISKRSAP